MCEALRGQIEAAAQGNLACVEVVLTQAYRNVLVGRCEEERWRKTSVSPHCRTVLSGWMGLSKLILVRSLIVCVGLVDCSCEWW